MSWKAFTEAIKLGPGKLIAMAVTCFVVILIPDEWARELGYAELIKPYHGWIALVGISSFCFGLVQLAPNFKEWLALRRQQRDILNSLDSLSDEEKFLLGYCLSRNRRTVLLGMSTKEYTIAAGLCHKRLMRHATGQQMVHAIPHTIPSFIWKEMLKRTYDFPMAEGDPNVSRYYNKLDKSTGGASAGY